MDLLPHVPLPETEPKTETPTLCRLHDGKLDRLLTLAAGQTAVLRGLRKRVRRVESTVCGNGQPGLVDRVDALEQQARAPVVIHRERVKRVRWWAKLLVPSAAALTGYALGPLVNWLLHRAGG
jgi:hypothetical protein